MNNQYNRYVQPILQSLGWSLPVSSVVAYFGSHSAWTFNTGVVIDIFCVWL